jgi:AAA family ATPase
LTEDLRCISTGYTLTLPTANLPSANDVQTTYTITEVVPSKQVGFTSPATAQKTVKADKATQDEIEERLARLSVGDAVEQEVYAMHVKTEVSFAVDEPTNGTDGKSSDQRTKATVKRSDRDTANPALPSYINIYPPGPLNSTSESFSAYATLGGLSKQIAQVRSLLDLPLSQPELYQKFGLKPPRGILLYGPPGTGKTHLARAISSSTEGCSCIVVNGPELSSAYHGETEERIRAVFDEAKKREPCIVVLDEVDAICPKREGGEGGEVERRVVATLLTLMDGMSEGGATVGGNEKAGADLARVVVIAATNRPNAVDPALRRPGRFDREIEIGRSY